MALFASIESSKSLFLGSVFRHLNHLTWYIVLALTNLQAYKLIKTKFTSRDLGPSKINHHLLSLCWMLPS